MSFRNVPSNSLVATIAALYYIKNLGGRESHLDLNWMGTHTSCLDAKIKNRICTPCVSQEYWFLVSEFRWSLPRINGRLWKSFEAHSGWETPNLYVTSSLPGCRRSPSSLPRLRNGQVYDRETFWMARSTSFSR